MMMILMTQVFQKVIELHRGPKTKSATGQLDYCYDHLDTVKDQLEVGKLRQ